MMRSDPGRIASVSAGVVVGLGLACGLAGCGGGGASDKDASPRVNASGTVEFDGQPVAAGTVTFMNHETGNMAICPISGGEYENDSDEGPNPGRNTVIIVGRESEESNPLWGGGWTKEVTVADTDFTENFKIGKDEVKPFDPKSIQIDE